MRLSSVFSDVIYVPYAVIVEGQIIRVYDPSIHLPLDITTAAEDNGLSVIRREEYDARWVPCRRPFVVTGGELTLEMLDLRYDATANYYEAPLHVKALGGCFIIDDFGRQLVSPHATCSIAGSCPSRAASTYLKLHTGKSFSIPFEELIIFSTNLEPEDLMDPAFLRRLPYKIEVASPTLENFRRIFQAECERQGLQLTEDVLYTVVDKLQNEKQMDLAAYMPRFIADQVVATCKFMGQPPHFEARYIDYALDNLRVKRNDKPGGAKTTARIADEEPVGAR